MGSTLDVVEFVKKFEELEKQDEVNMDERKEQNLGQVHGTFSKGYGLFWPYYSAMPVSIERLCGVSY